MLTPRTFYLCGVQRSGDFGLCEALFLERGDFSLVKVFGGESGHGRLMRVAHALTAAGVLGAGSGLTHHSRPLWVRSAAGVSSCCRSFAQWDSFSSPERASVSKSTWSESSRQRYTAPAMALA